METAILYSNQRASYSKSVRLVPFILILDVSRPRPFSNASFSTIQPIQRPEETVGRFISVIVD
jgi:hypothetical protein